MAPAASPRPAGKRPRGRPKPAHKRPRAPFLPADHIPARHHLTPHTPKGNA